MSFSNLDKESKRIIEKRRDTRHRTKREFISSLEIVKDHAKIKNIRCRQGVYYESKEEREGYSRGYTRIFGRVGPKPGCTGEYKWDAKLKEFVKVSDEIPSSRLVTL